MAVERVNGERWITAQPGEAVGEVVLVLRGKDGRVVERPIHVDDARDLYFEIMRACAVVTRDADGNVVM